MKKFILNLFIFSLPLLITAYLIDLRLSNKLSRSTSNAGEYEVWSDIYNGKIDSDVLIYGSSRAWVHIDPEIIGDSLNERIYNFGIDGSCFPTQYLRGLENMKYNHKPKLIIHSVDLFTLSVHKELYNMQQFLPYMLGSKRIFTYTHQFEGYSFMDYVVPLLRYRHDKAAFQLLLATHDTVDVEYRHRGFKGMDRQWNSDFQKAKEKNGCITINLDHKTIALYRTFLNECLNNGIAVVLVYSPEELDGQHFVVNREEIIQLYSQLANEFNLIFLDYSTNAICKNKAYFYNASHLNASGAQAFSKILGHDLNQHLSKDRRAF